jgi:hypothetical protein
MNPLKRIVGINLAALLLYSILIRIISFGSSGDKSMSILIMSAFAVGAHVFVCAIVTAFQFADKSKPLGRAWLLSTGLVLLVGFSTCLGNAALQ